MCRPSPGQPTYLTDVGSRGKEPPARSGTNVARIGKNACLHTQRHSTRAPSAIPHAAMHLVHACRPMSAREEGLGPCSQQRLLCRGQPPATTRAQAIAAAHRCRASLSQTTQTKHHTAASTHLQHASPTTWNTNPPRAMISFVTHQHVTAWAVLDTDECGTACLRYATADSHSWLAGEGRGMCHFMLGGRDHNMHGAAILHL
jgi:hypothetical protein